MSLSGDRILLLMQNAGIGPEKLSEMMKIGLTTLKRYTDGYSEPTAEDLAKLSVIFGVPSGYITGATDVPELSEPMYRVPVFKDFPQKAVDEDSEINPVEYICASGITDMKNCFFVIMDNDDMSAAKINQGDRVLINPDKSIVSGDLAAVSVDGGAPIIRRVYFDGPIILLNTEGKKPESIEYDSFKTQIQFLGSVVFAISCPV